MKHTAIRFDRTLINPKGDSVRYLEVSMDAPEPDRRSKRKRAPMDLALVIDRSGSMQGEPLAAAREAARGVAQQLRAKDTLSVVVFDDCVDTLFEGLSMTKAGKTRADAMLAGIHSGGMTCLSEGWLEGAETVARLGEDGRRSQVILLSDGHANRGITNPRKLAEHSTALRERGVYTTCVGIGDDYSPEQLSVLSENGGGLLHRAERPQEIIEVLMGELNELMNTYAEDIKVDVFLPAHGILAECVGELPTSRTENGVRCHLGSLIEGRQRHLILRLTCPRGEPQSSLNFKARITFKRPGGGEEAIELNSARLEFAGSRDSLRKQKRDKKLSLRVAELWQSDVVRKASGMNREGEYREASRMVRTQLAFFSRYCYGIPGTSKLISELELLQDRVRGEFSERGRKEMHNYAELRRYSKPEHRVHYHEDLDSFMN